MSIIVDPKDVLSATQYLKGLKSFDFQILMKLYRRHNEHYVLILKAVPMLCAVVASLKIAFDPVHRDARRDTLRASYLLWPCILIAGMLTPKLTPSKSSQVLPSSNNYHNVQRFIQISP